MRVPQPAAHCKQKKKNAVCSTSVPFIGEWAQEKRDDSLWKIFCVRVHVCIRECGCVYARTRAEVSVGSFSTLFETQAIVIVLVCQASLQVPRDFPVSASSLAVECWGYRYGLLFSNQSSDPHTHAGSSCIQTQP